MVRSTHSVPRGQSLSFLQKEQQPVTNHPQQLLHLTLRGQQQRLEAHAALPDTSVFGSVAEAEGRFAV